MGERKREREEGRDKREDKERQREETQRERRDKETETESLRERQRNREGWRKGGTYMYIYYTSAFLLPRLLPHGNSFIASGRVQWTGSLITASSDGNRAPTILPLLEHLFSEEDGDFTSSVLPSAEVAESSLLDSEEEEKETEDRTLKIGER